MKMGIGDLGHAIWSPGEKQGGNMPSFVVTTEFATPVEDTWNFFCDVDRYPEWIPFTQEVRGHDEGEMRVGYIYRERGGIPPLKGKAPGR
jgi:hypothetical protein